MQKTTLTYIFLIISIALTTILSSCSTEKNTSTARAYHQMVTKYNVRYNADISFAEGITAINKAHKEDFTQRIPVHTISNHDNAASAKTQMTRTIEKCRKAIKKHSITKPPKRDKKRWNNPNYQYFYNQEEYVKGVKDAWILLGKAEIYMGDFVGAAATFSYIQRHYPSDKNIVTEARIWQTIAYGEMGWNYEAEEALEKINENNITRKLNKDFALNKAYILLKNNNISEAIPFLQLASTKVKNKFQLSRIHFLLGQLYVEQNQMEKATNSFKYATKYAQNYPLEFNARLLMYQCDKNNINGNLKGLNKMLKNSNNANYQAQIYYTIGNIHLAQKDTTEAIAAFELGAQDSLQTGAEKAQLLIQLGDLYYAQNEYIKAQPCYQNAVNIITADHSDYRRLTTLSETLGELATNYNTVQLQDSLLHLATLSDDEQLAVVDKIIEQVKKDEEEAARKAKEANKGFVAPGRASSLNGFANQSRDWYFYNAQLISNGATQFIQKWGQRTLEDNWRRSNKISSLLGQNDDLGMDSTTVNNDSTAVDDAQLDEDGNKIPQTHDPNFYLSQIPKTENDITASNQLIAKSLYEMAKIYDLKLNNYPISLDTYKEYQHRYNTDTLMLESLYSSYKLCEKLNNETDKENYKNQIINDYPNSTYAAILSQPDYIERMQRMYSMQDSIYKETYKAYSNGEFNTVQTNYSYMTEEFPLSNLLPKFAFLNALSIGKTLDKDTFYTALTQLVETYPQSDVTPMSKDIIALIKQGRENQKGSTHGTMLAKRDEETTAKVNTTNDKDFIFEEKTQYVLLLTPKDTTLSTVNQLLYDVAAFNFTKFMIKEFDINVRNIAGTNSVAISLLESYATAQWYESMLLAEPSLQGKITLDKVKRIIISEDNLQLIQEGKTWEEYQHFYKLNQ